ncbi:MAG: protein kinase [Candidatus Eisenbacteria bacterium]|uniref:Protein kinase n=1 Tax=Eiseniibacteriota bacterium TaxID=2212470 RepID=A0A956NDA9_UNCEI|nr:protein kinase [Candidatus Eisenbacteria bacterium]MCB9463573.1 protein kinase [Candidatus Eisenbacteria bacterium]
MALPPGHRIGSYEVLGPAGAGGMGEVYRARDSRLERTVAIKALPADLKDNAGRRGRFEQEARLLAALNHPNIAGIHGIEDAADGSSGPYLILEFVDGETLAERLSQGPIPVTETIHLGTQMAAAIEAAHEKGIIHRDIKPGNVMINPSGTVKVLDFGLAKDELPTSGSDAELTKTHAQAYPATAEGMVLGTAAYMSPEQARGFPTDKRADIWAFGCVLMECLSGRQVFSGETPSDVIAQILEREPDWTRIPSGTPPRLQDVIRRCLTKDVNLRPRDVGDIGRELKSLGADGTTSHPVKAARSTPSIAVLYFENLANDKDSEYFCAGITEDILTDLSKIKSLRVASKNAVSRYRGQEVDLTRIARDLGVSAVLEGSVRRAGDRIRITTQLINTADGFQLWGERFDRTLEDVFAVQDEIASAIVDSLRVAMSPSDIQEMARDRPENVKAYDLYLRGREKYSLYEQDAMKDALALFQEAISLEPEYALAWSGVADCCGQFLIHRWSEDSEAIAAQGMSAVRRAVALDPKLPDAFKAEANILVATNAPDEEVVQALTKALSVDPNFTPALINLGINSFTRGDLARTERLARRVLELDPQEGVAVLWLVAILFWTRRWEETLTLIRQARVWAAAHFSLTILTTFEFRTRLELGDPEEADRVLARALADERVDSEHLWPLRAQLCARQNRNEEAREILQGASIAPSRYFLMAPVVEAAFRLGEPDLATTAIQYSRTINRIQPMVFRLESPCHPLLDREEFGPRVCPWTLTWPLQAPMIDEDRFQLFREVKVESGRPGGSELRGNPTQV